jgi:hypothetical protein
VKFKLIGPTMIKESKFSQSHHSISHNWTNK